MIQVVFVVLLAGALFLSGLWRWPLTAAAPPRPPEPARPDPAPPERGQVRRLAERLSRLEAVYGNLEAPVAPSPSVRSYLDDRFRVGALASRGKTPAAIAHQLRLSESEVYLMLRMGATREATARSGAAAAMVPATRGGPR
jgi:hypothetical protein